ncbi:hypothetical protein HY251_08925 [bacterium]|nr:hypothetical protein [bacterium]
MALGIPALLCSGPLVVFGRLAMGERVTLRAALRSAARGTIDLLPNGLAFCLLLGAMGVGVAGAISLFFLTDVLMAALIALVIGRIAVVIGGEVIRTFPLDTLIRAVISDEAEKRAALDSLDARTRGRTFVFLAALGVPVGIVALSAGGATPVARELIEKLIGPEGEVALLVCVTILGVIVALFLGSAMLAAAYAVILGSPTDGAVDFVREDVSPVPAVVGDTETEYLLDEEAR